MPELFQGLQFPFTDRLRVLIRLHKSGAFPLVFLPQQEGHCHSLSRLQGHSRRERAAAVAVVAQAVPEVPTLHAYGTAVSPVGSQEFRPVAAVGGNLRPGQSEESLDDGLGVHLVLRRVQIAVNLLADPVFVEQGSGDKLGVLQVHLVLLIIAVAGKLRVAREGQRPGAVRVVAHRQPPDLVGPAQGHIISRLAVDAAIIRRHDRVAHSVAALAFVRIQVLSHRLPGGGPEVPRLVVPKIEIPPRLVELVEHIPKNPSVGPGFDKAVASGVVGDQRPVLRGAQVVGPRGRGVGPGDHVLMGLIVKKSILHRASSPYINSTVI